MWPFAKKGVRCLCPGSGGSGFDDFSNIGIRVRPGDTLSVVLETTGNAADYVASLSWKEDS